MNSKEIDRNKKIPRITWKIQIEKKSRLEHAKKFIIIIEYTMEKRGKEL